MTNAIYKKLAYAAMIALSGLSSNAGWSNEHTSLSHIVSLNANILDQDYVMSLAGTGYGTFYDPLNNTDNSVDPTKEYVLNAALSATQQHETSILGFVLSRLRPREGDNFTSKLLLNTAPESRNDNTGKIELTVQLFLEITLPDTPFIGIPFFNKDPMIYKVTLDKGSDLDNQDSLDSLMATWTPELRQTTPTDLYIPSEEAGGQSEKVGSISDSILTLSKGDGFNIQSSI